MKYVCIICGSLLAILLVSCASSSNTSKQNSIPDRTEILVNEQIDVIFFDPRSEEINTDSVRGSIKNHLIESFPAVNFQVLEDSVYMADPDTGKITIKINLGGYEGGPGVEFTSATSSVDGNPLFFSGVDDTQWNSIKGIFVLILDTRLSDETETPEASDGYPVYDVESLRLTIGPVRQPSLENVLNNVISFLDDNLIE